MDSNPNPPGNGGGGGNNPPVNFPLTRQPSIYSLTFDEFQSNLGKDFGSVNMDELLKNIWSAEETQAMGSTGGTSGGAGGGQEGLQRQGSLTLPRTLSQKTVDEVWRDISKEYTVGKDGNNSGGGSNMPQRQQTLGEMTLEEFLVRAGVVREETQLAGKVNNGGLFGNITNASLGIGFQQSSDLPLNVNRVISSHQQQQQQHPILPKQPAFGYRTQMPWQGSAQLGSPEIRSGVAAIGDQGMNNTGLVQSETVPSGGLVVPGGLSGGHVSGATGSPITPLSSDGSGRRIGDISSVSPGAYMFGGGLRGRKSSGVVEKVAERRQRRMIKNRESAARSRARKQAYTMELEAEIAKLKEENQELRGKQAKMMEMEKIQEQATEKVNLQGRPEKRLRRTESGPW